LKADPAATLAPTPPRSNGALPPCAPPGQNDRVIRTPSRSRLPALLLVCSLALPHGIALAQPSATEKAEADALFNDGRKLMGQKRYAEACRKLEASQKLDPAGGTLLNLAVCHEAEGKLATAWVEFNDALVQAKSDKKLDRVKLARERIADLEGKLPKITITLDPAVKPGQVEVKRDGQSVSDALFGTAVPVDPGPHTVSASAPGHKAWTTSIDLGAGDARTVVVPELAIVKAPAPPASSSPPPPPPPPRGRLIAGYVVGGVGLLALGVGTYFGVRTLSKKSQSDDQCPTADTCTDEGVELNDAARQAATVSNIGLGLGIVGVGVGAFLVLTAPRGHARRVSPSGNTSSLRLAPTGGPGGGGLSLSGAF
jgi:hypothetical protein